VPRVYPSLGRVLNRAKLAALPEMRDADDLDVLQKYLALVEAPQQPETLVTWSGFDALQIKATVADGESVLLQETYDPAWRAYANGKPLAIRKDHIMGFMLIDAPAGQSAIDMRFETPLQNRIGLGLAILSLLIVGGLLVTGGAQKRFLSRNR